jgi:hypothetical protein
MEEVREAEMLAKCAEGRVLDCGAVGKPGVVDAELLRRCCVQFSDQVDPRGVRLKNARIVGSLDLAGLDVPFPLRFEGCEFDSPPVVEGAQLHELALTGCPQLPGLLANGVRIRRDLDLSRTHVAGAHKTSASTSRRAAVWLCESDIGGRLLCVDTFIDASGERSIQADRMHVRGTVRLLHQFSARGDVRLLGARIDGSLDFTGAHISSRLGLALDLGDAIIGGSVFLIADTAGRRPVIQGRIDMGSARISGQFLIRDATLEAPAVLPGDSGYSRSRAAGTALSAPRLTVGAEMTFEKTCRVSGGIDLSMSELSSLLIDSGCSLHAAGRTALDLTNAELLSTFTVGEMVAVEGTVRLSGARIHGNLCLRGARLSMPERRSLVAAQGVNIDGAAELRQLEAAGGELGFRSATIGSVIDTSGACLRNPGGYTLNLNQANVKGSVLLADGFESSGKVVLNRASIEGRLQCTTGSFDCPAPSERNRRGHAIEAISAEIRGGMDLGWASISPSVDFTNTKTSFLADNPQNWPARFTVSGLTYDRFEQPQDGGPSRTWDETARCAWLNKQTVYDAGPYEQAARVFRQHGYSNGAKAILIAQRRHARQAITGAWAMPRRVLDVAYSLTVGYGYRPGRVLWLLIILLVLVTGSLQIPGARAAMRSTTAAGVVFTTQGPLRSQGADPVTTRSGSHPASDDACGDGQVRCFNPVLYAIDTVIPLVSLDQRSTWYPEVHTRDGALMQWWLNAAAVLGWLLTSIFVLSLASLARSL